MHTQVLIFGVPVDNLNMEGTLDHLEQFIQLGRATGKAHQVATVNLDFITNALDDPDLLAILQNVDLAMPDGMPVVWGARLLGAPVHERVAGVDMVLGLAERAAQNGYSLYLMGAAPGVAARAAEVLQERFPGLKIAGVSAPMVRSLDEPDTDLLAEIRAAKPDVLLVAFGNPKQEKWIARFGSQVKVPVMVGVGGTFDFITGGKKRAPRWMQISGLEWVYRLVQEPGRLWRRYRRNLVVYCVQIARQWWLLRGSRKPVHDRADFSFRLHNNIEIVRVQGSLLHNDCQTLINEVRQALTLTPNILFDLSQVKALDGSAYGTLVRLAKEARDQGGDLALASVPSNIARELSLLRLGTCFCVYPDLEMGLGAHVNREYAGGGIPQPVNITHVLSEV